MSPAINLASACTRRDGPLAGRHDPKLAAYQQASRKRRHGAIYILILHYLNKPPICVADRQPASLFINVGTAPSTAVVIISLTHLHQAGIRLSPITVNHRAISHQKYLNGHLHMHLCDFLAALHSGFHSCPWQPATCVPQAPTGHTAPFESTKPGLQL